MSQPNSAMKTVKRGEMLFKENDKIQTVYVIQGGTLQLVLQREKKNIELTTLTSGQFIGENGVLSQSVYPCSGIAASEVKVLEISAESLKQLVEASSQPVKMLIKSLLEKQKVAFADLKSTRIEKDSTPLPEHQVAKAFAAVFHTANHKGTKQKDSILIDWNLYKQYSQRLFEESPKRLEQSLSLLTKLKLAKFHMGKRPEDPEGPDEIQQVELFNLGVVEAFFEFFQYYHFKGGKSDILKYDEYCANILGSILKQSEGQVPDRFGIVSVEYAKMLEGVKSDIGVQLAPDHFTRLEQKGVLVKRKTTTEGKILIQFEDKEFKNIFWMWKILKEIDKWNDKGFVDVNEKETPSAKKNAGPSCPSCNQSVDGKQKFCGQCGHKLAA